MSETNQGYRKKQALLVLVIFACIGVTIMGYSPLVSVGAMVAACGIVFYAASLEPAKSPEEHHH